MEKDLIDFKERLEDDEEFKGKFKDVLDFNEAIEIAREEGYDISADEAYDDNILADQILELASGGIGNNYHNKINNKYLK